MMQVADAPSYVESQKALREAIQLLFDGQEVSLDISTKIAGDGPKQIFHALNNALVSNGIVGVQDAFEALCQSYSWLNPLWNDGVAEGKAKRRIRFVSSADIKNRPTREWLLPGILAKRSVAMVYGLPACGKSLLVLDWAECIGRGMHWMGHPTTKGHVAYIAAEGDFGLGARINAWEHHNRVTHDADGIGWYPGTVLLNDPGSLEELTDALHEDFPQAPSLVVIDTLSRCSNGADENSNKEMASIIASADALQQEFGCTVLIIHHQGKDGTKGPRGASALTGNMETVIEVAATDEGCKVTCYKQKDAPKFAPITLKLLPVQYGPDEYDSSVVLILGKENAPLKMTSSESTMYAALQEKSLRHKDWTQLGMSAGISESSAKKAIKSLLEAHRVQLISGFYSIPSLQESEDEIE